MSDLNQCNFFGRVTKDPITRFTANGDPVCNFSIACNWKTKAKEGVEFISISSFGKIAEMCQKSLKTGSQVYISGRLKNEKYEKDGVTKYSTKISADTVQFLSKSESEPATKDDDFIDDNIPF